MVVKGGDIGNAIRQAESPVVTMCESFIPGVTSGVGTCFNHFLGKRSTNISEYLAKGEKEKEGNKFFFLQVIVFYLLGVNGFWRIEEQNQMGWNAALRH